MNNEDATQRRLGREARETLLGTLGDRDGINVAKVEVCWWYERGLDLEEHAGFYFVHATGDEPRAQGEEGTIYNVFEDLVHERMLERQERLGFAGYEINDISAA